MSAHRRRRIYRRKRAERRYRRRILDDRNRLWGELLGDGTAARDGVTWPMVRDNHDFVQEMKWRYRAVAVARLVYAERPFLTHVGRAVA